MTIAAFMSDLADRHEGSGHGSNLKIRLEMPVGTSPQMNEYETIKSFSVLDNKDDSASHELAEHFCEN